MVNNDGYMNLYCFSRSGELPGDLLLDLFMISIWVSPFLGDPQI